MNCFDLIHFNFFHFISLIIFPQASSVGQGYSSQPSAGLMSQSGVIPVTALGALGVAAEAVGQINELKNYLSRQVR